MRKRSRVGTPSATWALLLVGAFSTPGEVVGQGRVPRPGPDATGPVRRSGDPVLDWNAIMLQANANDFDPGYVATPDQKGPTRTSRAFAIVHAAIYDAVNSIDRVGSPYRVEVPGAQGASIPAAVAVAGRITLAALYPHQVALFDAELARSLAGVDPEEGWRGAEVGAIAAGAILLDRAGDGSARADGPYTPIPRPGYHRPDPLHPDQGFLTVHWGRVRPFALDSAARFRAANFVGDDPGSRLAWLRGPVYTAMFDEVKTYGSKASTVRTPDQTEVGIFWSYDGSPRIGTPPRLYNQAVRAVAEAVGGQSVAENARLFALANLAMADAAVVAWDTKYHYQLWRPIVGIREAATAGNPATVADPAWEPLGAQADNGSGTNFTPPFPSYVSGHATLGSATFQALRRYFGRDEIPFALQSDEFNGVTRDQHGAVRPARTRFYRDLTQAEQENHDSRIYLGVHWRADQDQGTVAGRAVADYVFDHALRTR